MSVTMIPTPGTTGGPCRGSCNHAKCHTMRAMADERCHHCGVRFGFGSKITGEPPLHLRCAQAIAAETARPRRIRFTILRRVIMSPVIRATSTSAVSFRILIRWRLLPSGAAAGVRLTPSTGARYRSSVNSEKVSQVRALRDRLHHPVIDADGHLIEPAPLFNEYLRKVGGGDMLDRYNHELREHPTGSRGNRDAGDMRGAWWGVSNDAYDLATVMAPRLLYSRLDDLGVDFSILYPTLGLALPTIHDGEVRRIACRALNTMNAKFAGSFATGSRRPQQSRCIRPMRRSPNWSTRRGLDSRSR